MTTQSMSISDPPQMWRPLTLREICHGQKWGWASSPFTTLLEIGRFPQPVKLKNDLIRSNQNDLKNLCHFITPIRFTYISFLGVNLNVEQATLELTALVLF